MVRRELSWNPRQKPKHNRFEQTNINFNWGKGNRNVVEKVLRTAADMVIKRTAASSHEKGMKLYKA